MKWGSGCSAIGSLSPSIITHTQNKDPACAYCGTTNPCMISVRFVSLVLKTSIQNNELLSSFLFVLFCTFVHDFWCASFPVRPPGPFPSIMLVLFLPPSKYYPSLISCFMNFYPLFIPISILKISFPSHGSFSTFISLLLTQTLSLCLFVSVSPFHTHTHESAYEKKLSFLLFLLMMMMIIITFPVVFVFRSLAYFS